VLEHGGRVRAAAQRYGIPVAEWLDLSTGIAPFAYAVPPVPVGIWQRLPEENDGLEAAARAYYGTTRLLPLPGSQAAIQLLPRLRPRGRMAVLAPGYGEHAAAWRAAGHAVQEFSAAALEAAAENADTDAIVLGNPNNPDGSRFNAARLLAVARQLRARGVWLIVDEAFADADPADSLAHLAGDRGLENLIVLRSLGKFFGLAGARVGIAIAAPEVLERLREVVGPWAIAGPSRWAALHALGDCAWQAEQRLRLGMASLHLARLLKESGLGEPAGTVLFQFVLTPHAAAIHEALARRGILVRLFEEPAALRFGLPGSEAERQRLADVLLEPRSWNVLGRQTINT
jgi:cobalamin biosynthetic protein CobC